MTTANRFSALFTSPTKNSNKYTNDFPELGKDLGKELGKELGKDLGKELGSRLVSEPKVETRFKKTSTKIILGHRSYEEERQSQISSAYDVLADKEKLASSLHKTRMCNSLHTNEPCQHEDKCRFAHSLDELKISDCLFGQRCRFVRMSNGELINTDNTTKVCTHKHQHESTESFMRRTGLDRYKCTQRPVLQKVVVHPAPPFSPSQPPPPLSSWTQRLTVEQPTVEQPTVEQPTVEQPTVEQPTVEQPTVEQPTVEQPTFEQHKIVTKQERVDSDQILVIRVPKQLASQALEIAIKSGKSSVQIVIVD